MAGHERIFVGIGANLGAAAATVRRAVIKLNAVPRTNLVAASSLYRSAPVDASGPDYINAVAELRSELEPLELLAALQVIEQAHGRTRRFQNAPRTLDLDLLLYGAREHRDDRLVLPHPRAAERAFVLAPLLELAPDGAWADGRSFAQALATVQGSVQHQRIERLLLGASGADAFSG